MMMHCGIDINNNRLIYCRVDRSKKNFLDKSVK